MIGREAVHVLFVESRRKIVCSPTAVLLALTKRSDLGRFSGFNYSKSRRVVAWLLFSREAAHVLSLTQRITATVNTTRKHTRPHIKTSEKL